MNSRHILENILKLCTIICFTALILVVTLQISARFLPITLSWTEELSRLLFVYSISFSAPLAMKKKDYVNVDLLLNFLPEKFRNIYEGVIYLIITVFLSIVVIKGFEFIQTGQGQTSPVLKISMAIPHSSMIITSIFIAVYALIHAFNYFKLGTKASK